MDKKVPAGRLGRPVRLAKLGLQTGGALLGARDDDEKTAKIAAERAADVLGSMRGLAAKVGQMASYVYGLVRSTASAQNFGGKLRSALSSIWRHCVSPSVAHAWRHTWRSQLTP